MRLFLHRRIISALALLAFVSGIAVPALAVARQAVDPAAFATICRVDSGAAANPALPGAPAATFKHAHCLMCVSTASPPPVHDLNAACVVPVPELLLPADRGAHPAAGMAALHPLEPRAPPRA